MRLIQSVGQLVSKPWIRRVKRLGGKSKKGAQLMESGLFTRMVTDALIRPCR